MIEAPTTWGDVWTYGYVIDKNGAAWKIAHEKAGWVELVNREGDKRQMPRPPDPTPVTTLLMTEPEAFAVIKRHFPGAEIIEIKED